MFGIVNVSKQRCCCTNRANRSVVVTRCGLLVAAACPCSFYFYMCILLFGFNSTPAGVSVRILRVQSYLYQCASLVSRL